MKKIQIYIAIIMMGILAACTDDLLDQKPLSSFTDNAVWSDLALAETYLSDQYNSIEAETQKGSRFASFTDEVYQMHKYGTESVVQGTLSPDQSNTGWDGSTWNPWQFYYKAISNANIFLEKIEQVPANGAANIEWKRQLKGQAFFLRGYFYCQLYSLFGEVPIITKSYGLNDDFFKDVTRSPKDQVAEYIVSQCDSAVKYLPVNYSDAKNWGRATKGASLALKARTLLYAASPLFGTPSQAKWKRASDASKAVIDLKDENGVIAYSLQSVSSSEEYANLFVDNKNPEVIFEKLYNSQNEGIFNFSYLSQAPCGSGSGFGGWGNFQPTQEIVDQFDMADGKPYSRGAKTENPYLNRDLRLAATVFTDGSRWGYGADDREVETFFSGEEGVPNGQDSRQGDTWWNGTQTGYYIKKFLDRKFNTYGTESASTPWFVFRLAEFYLNYAECQIELGNTDEALTYINKIRERALLPNITADNIVEKYRHERQIELVFEGQRWFDIRRWKTIENVYQKPVTGMIIMKFNNGSKTYELNSKPIETKVFNAPQNYWLPIPRSELRKAKNLDPAPYK
jgi:hypothetical protein